MAFLLRHRFQPEPQAYVADNAFRNWFPAKAQARQFGQSVLEPRSFQERTRRTFWGWFETQNTLLNRINSEFIARRLSRKKQL
jgi:hypothetical protein